MISFHLGLRPYTEAKLDSHAGYLLNFDLDQKYQIHLDEKTNKRDAILTVFLVIYRRNSTYLACVRMPGLK